MFSVSKDRGASWSPPSPVHSSAFSDSFDDINPTVSVNSDGIFAVTWLSAENFASLSGFDYDAFYSESLDRGVTWSIPKILNANFGTDNADESSLSVYANPNSQTFIATWVCCKAGTASIFTATWSLPPAAALSRIQCAAVDQWSNPGAISFLASSDSATDTGVRVASNGNGSVVATWSSNAQYLELRPFSPNLVFWWPLSAAPVVDSTGQNYAGTLNGTFVEGRSPLMGNSGTVMNLDGKTSVRTTLSAFPRQYTISFWWVSTPLGPADGCSD